jgi:hypothetical protein
VGIEWPEWLFGRDRVPGSAYQILLGGEIDGWDGDDERYRVSLEDRVLIDAWSGAQASDDPDDDAGLLKDLARGRLLESLARLASASRQQPEALARVWLYVLDEQEA